MAVPDFQSCMLPLLKFLADGKERTLHETVDAIAVRFGLTEEDRKALIPSGKQTLIANRVGWARTYIKKAGLLESVKRGRVKITQRGQELLAGKPSAVNVKLLERYQEFQEFRALRHEKSPQEEDHPEDSTKTPEEA